MHSARHSPQVKNGFAPIGSGSADIKLNHARRRSLFLSLHFPKFRLKMCMHLFLVKSAL